ncbi:MAG: hypothetical protein K2M82_04530 [Lachnospiraceae bacterium]|nr:hypothetical protein [Lachnospiraceae bacterium]
MKKYELTEETREWYGITLHRIKALKDIGSSVKAGDLGGWVQSENNLSHKGGCWVHGNARVCDNAEVYSNARVYGNAEVHGDAEVYGNARVCGDAEVYGNALVREKANIQSTADYITVGPIGSRDDFTTFYRTSTKGNEIYVKCGCKNTDIDTWLAMVEKTHGNNKHGKMYREAAELAYMQIKKLED